HTFSDLTGGTVVSPWGVTFHWPEGQIGQFPLHDEEHLVLKDIDEWEKYVKKPAVPTNDEAWEAAVKHAESIDRNEKFVAPFVAPGIFEMTHHLMSMEEALMALYESPDKMKELIDLLVEYELDLAKEITRRLKPDALFHHDDWGSQKNSFIAPDMFEEFFLPAYKKIYGYYREQGVELIVHHNDSYSANLVPHMIDMGIDIWQGVMTTNNTPELIKKYGDKISFMGDLDSGVIDFPEWSKEIIDREVERACTNCGKHYFIPCLTQGLGFSSFPGVYDEVSKSIDEMSKKMF
ncbi:MAG TPA: uroporphyrinogen decarboxylase, partial [Eubacteriaceae bacterium]|nr:uroporphyrinogen decarboxylase [Eubacteriaceae bacterium]